MKKRILAVTLAFAMVLALTACGGGAGGGPAASDNGGANTTAGNVDVGQLTGAGSGLKHAEGQNTVDEATKQEIIDSHTNADGKTFISIATASNCSSFEPYKSIKNTNIFGKPVYEGLYSRCGVGGEYVPVIAESTEKIDDTTYRVKIKDYIYDSQGNHITASDVKFSYWDVAKETYNNGYFRQLNRVEVVDDYTVDFYMDTPSEALFIKMTYNYVWSEKAFTDSGDSMASWPTGTGPYVVTDWVSGSYVTYEKRDDYWETDPAKIAECSEANVDIMNYKVIKDEAQMVIALQTGEADISENLSAKNISFFSGDSNYNVFSELNNKTLLIAFNCNQDYSPCGDVYLRQAILYATDRNALSIGVYDGQGAESKGPTTPTAADFNSEWLNNEYYAYNLEKAQECLEQSGYDGEELVILVEAEDELNKGAQVLQNCLLAVGINTTITAVESALYTTYRYDPAQYDIQLMTSGCSDFGINSWVQNCDTSEIGTSNMGVQDLELYEILMDAVDKAPGDPESVEILYDYLTDNAMYVGLYNSMKSIVCDTAVTSCVTDYAQYVNPAACTYVWNG